MGINENFELVREWKFVFYNLRKFSLKSAQIKFSATPNILCACSNENQQTSSKIVN